MWCDDSGETCHAVEVNDLEKLADAFIGKAGHHPVWIFHGEMGSGKTTFIKTLCARLGVRDVMSSPTFSIVNEYRTVDDKKVYHFDCYRIRNEAEAYDIGTEEYFYSGNVCFVEWPEKIPSLIPAEHVEITIAVENENQRTIALSVHDGKEKNGI